MLSQFGAILFIGLLIKENHSLTCDGILEASTEKKYVSLPELQSMPAKELTTCLPHLSKEQLPFPEAAYIWQSIKTYYGGVANVPEKILMTLHWVTPAIQPEEYTNITLDSIDVVQNFGLDYGLNRDQLAAIADDVRDNYSGKYPEDYTYYDLTALRQILCAFNRSEIERIHARAYKEASALIGKLNRCSLDAMLGFATLAMKTSAFGPPELWDDVVAEMIGAVAEYVPKIAMVGKSN